MSRTTQQEVHVPLPFRLAMAAALLVAACAAPGVTQPTADPSHAVNPTASMTDGSEPSGSIGRGTPMASDRTPAAQPAGWLRLPGSGEVPGELGSWTLDGNGSDAPWLPASALRPVPVALSGHLEVGYRDGLAIGSWGAWLAVADDPQGASAVWIGGRETPDPALPVVIVEGITPGAWVLAVRLDRADGRGDATFYWRLVAS